MNIKDIIPDFSKMSDEEIEGVIRGVRRSRTTAKAVTLTKRPAKEASKAKASVSSTLGKMTDDQKDLLKKLFS